MTINKPSLLNESDIRASIEEQLKKETGKYLSNLRKEIEGGKTSSMPKENMPEDQGGSSKEEILNQNRDLFDKFFQNNSNTGNEVSKGNGSPEQQTPSSKSHIKKIESRNTQTQKNEELKKEFDALNIDPYSLGHEVTKNFSNSNAHGTYTEFKFDEGLEKQDENGNTYIEANGTKFYKVEYPKENGKTTGIIYKGKFISNEELKNSTETMYTYSNSKWVGYGEKMQTVEIALMRGGSISGIQFTGTSIYRTDWNLNKGTNGRWKPIRQNKTTIL